ALEFAGSSEDLIYILSSMGRSNFDRKEYLAYNTLYKIMETSGIAFEIFMSLLRGDKELSRFINELVALNPSPIFHYLLGQKLGKNQKIILACTFLPLSHFINDPDPGIILNEQFVEENLSSMVNSLKKAC
ncbi:MAG: hypothetical protein ACK4ND_14195, partial [Cytophagaceae bacterium]